MSDAPEYRYIGRDGKPVLARDLEDQRDAAIARAETAEAKIAAWEDNDGMDGAVVCLIRKLLDDCEVPKAAFIDDHVINAIVQRNDAIAAKEAAEKERDVLRAALSEIEGAASPDHWVPQYQHCVDIARQALKGTPNAD